MCVCVCVCVCVMEETRQLNVCVASLVCMWKQSMPVDVYEYTECVSLQGTRPPLEPNWLVG